MSSAINAISSAMTSGASSLNALTNTPAAAAETPGTDSTPFASLMKDSISEVNKLQDQAGETVRGLMSGSGVDVHEAMIATQKASMAFELTLSVRNKAVQAYQSIMGMQF